MADPFPKARVTRGLYLVFFWSILLFACQESNSSRSIRVALASNLYLPLQEIEAAWENNGGADLNLIPGASGVLASQIREGAPFDLFLSARADYVDSLCRLGLCQQEPVTLAYGTQRLWFRERPGSDHPGVALADHQVLRIALADPVTAPFGRAAKEWLVKEGLWDSLAFKFVYGSAVSQVNNYISSAVVDAAFTGNSAQKTLESSAGGEWVTLGGNTNHHLSQVGVILNGSTSSAVAFFNYLQGPEARQIFRNYGYEFNPTQVPKP